MRLASLPLLLTLQLTAVCLAVAIATPSNVLAAAPKEFQCSAEARVTSCSYAVPSTVTGVGWDERKNVAEVLGEQSCTNLVLINRAICGFNSTFSILSECRPTVCLQRVMGEPVFTWRPDDDVYTRDVGRDLQFGRCEGYGGRLVRRWYVNDIEVPGAEDSIFTLTEAAAAQHHGLRVHCTLSNPWGTVKSGTRLVQIRGLQLTPLRFGDIPPTEVPFGASARIECPIEADYYDTVVRWFFNGELLEHDFSTLTVSNEEELGISGSSGAVRCEVETAGVSVVSNTATVRFLAPNEPLTAPVPSPTPKPRILATADSVGEFGVMVLPKNVSAKKNKRFTVRPNLAPGVRISAIGRLPKGMAVAGGRQLTGVINRRGSFNVALSARSAQTVQTQGVITITVR